MQHEIILEKKINDCYFQSKVLKRRNEEVKNKKVTAIKKKLKKEVEDDKKIYMKDNIKKDIKNCNELKQINKISGIFSKYEEFEKYIKGLIPYSFGIWYNFELISPYFSSDDDDLYAVQNPILKEYTTKVPMVRGSSWKGILSSAALKILREKTEDENILIDDVIDYYLSFIRIFGTGSESFRKVKEEIKKLGEKNNGDNKKWTKALIEYCLFDLGININIKKDGTSIREQLINQISQNKNKRKVKNVFSVQKGRAIFYPTYFAKLKYELINPHDRKKRAGKNPLTYEVVPKKAKGIFQLVYIPYDGVLLRETDLNNEIKKDEEFIKILLKEVLETIGIGAKTKLGWGRAKVDISKVKCFYSNMGGVR